VRGVNYYCRAIIDVAGDDDGIHPGVACNVDKLAEDVALIVREVDLVEEASEVPIGGMQETHSVGIADKQV
jgi:hypothetical protein